MNKINDLGNQVVKWMQKTNPFLATRYGTYLYEDQVPDFSQESIALQIAELEQFQVSLNKIKHQDLSTHQQVNWALVDITIRQHLRQLKVIKHHELDPGYVASQIMGISYLMLSRNYMPLNKRLDNLQKRLNKTSKMLKASRSMVINPPLEFTKQAIAQCQRGGLRFFKENVPLMIEAQGGTITNSLQNTLDHVIEAFECHLHYLEELLPHSNGDFAIGESVFNEMLKDDYMMEYDCESLITKGWALLIATESQLEALAAEINPTSNWQAIIEEMKEDHPHENGLLEAYQKELDRVHRFVIEHEIADIPPREELIIIETPPHMRSLFPYAGYSGPAVFDDFQSGRFWVTPVEPEWSKEMKAQKLREHMIYKLPVFVLHEGYPGHHLQITTQHRITEDIRKIIHNNLYCEGWAFYCEELLEDLGFINEPKTKLSRLKDQLWRASRIIIDASVHSGRMSFTEAVDFLVERAHLERLNAIAEVNRYIKNPLRPMSYLMGKLEIQKIAEDYKAYMGDDYSMKIFHNALLALGAIPPALVRKELIG